MKKNEKHLCKKALSLCLIIIYRKFVINMWKEFEDSLKKNGRIYEDFQKKMDWGDMKW